MSIKSIKKNTVYNVIRTISSLFFPIITLPYINRVLTVNNIGRINFSSSIVSFFGLIASLGISTYAIRECSAVRDDSVALSKLASQIYSINIIMTVFAYISLLILLILSPQLGDYKLIILMQSISIAATTLGAEWFNQSMEDFRFISLRTLFFQLIVLILLFFFIRKPEDYYKYVILNLIANSGTSIVNIGYRKRFCKIRFTTKIDWNRHFRAIVFLFAMIMFQTLFTSVDTIMLGFIKGDHEVGIYSVASKISFFVAQGIDSIVFVIMPRMSYYYAKGDYNEINNLLRKTLSVLIAIGLPCSVGCICLSKNIILLVAGQSYHESALVLRVLSVGIFFLIVGGGFLGNCILLPSKNEKDFMIASCVTVAFNIVLNFLLIPYGGAKAAAGTSVASSFLLFIVLLIHVDKKIVINKLNKILITPIIGSIGIAIVCYVFNEIDNILLSIFLSISTSVLVYSAILYLGKYDMIMEVLRWTKNKINILGNNRRIR